MPLIPNGFKFLPKKFSPTKPATAVTAPAPMPATVIAESDGFDEEGRLLITEPLRPMPRPAPTILKYQRNRDGQWQIIPGEKRGLTPDDIPF